MKLTKIVFPVAGHGSRFLPVTKATPKEMLPIVDKPLIQYAVEEALDAGFTDLIFITGKTKRAITDHFDTTLDIGVSNITEKKKKLFEDMNNIIPKSASCIYLRQGEPLGLGHAILQAKPVLGDEPFAVLLADDLIDSKPGALKQMVEQYNDEDSSLIAVQKVEKKDSIHYGMIESDNYDEKLINIIDIQDFLLLNIWKIVSYSGKYPISIQNKKGFCKVNKYLGSRPRWICGSFKRGC